MSARDLILLAISALRGGIVRTFLTILGLGVGVGAVLTVLTLGDAGEVRVEEEIAKLGVNKVWIRSKQDDCTLVADDADLLKQSTHAEACAGAYTASTIAVGRSTLITQIAGFDASVSEVHLPKVLSGRMFRSIEFDQGSPVCLIDEALAERYDGDPVGEYVTIANRRLRIVGVIKGMTMQAMSGGTGLVIMPLKTYADTFGENIAEITLIVPPGLSAEAVADKALLALVDGEGYRADTLETEINAAREVVRIFVTVLVCVSFVCMLTGGIGIMNVLFISIRERRHEIGLIKAIGGTSGQVGLIFLMEAAVYSFIGGIFGIGLGHAMTEVFSRLIGLQAALDFIDAVPVLLAATGLGVGFGVIPAIKAAGMQPVEALSCD